MCTLFFGANAQGPKPTKEETQKFLQSMMKSVLGKDVNVGRYTLTKNSFSEDFESQTCIEVNHRGKTQTYEVTLIDWSKLKDGYQAQSFGDKDVISFSCFFTNKVKVISTNVLGGVEEEMKQTTKKCFGVSN